MKSIFLTIVALLAGAICAGAQDYDDIYSSGNQRVNPEVVTPAEKSKQERKAVEEQLQTLGDSLANARALRAMDNAHWVLLADRVSVGNAANVVYNLNSNANFIFQQGNKGMVQVAFNSGEPGLNGLGGVTLEGRIGNVQSGFDKSGNAYYSFIISGSEINAHVYISITKGSNRAQADVDMIFSSGRITLYGNLVPYNHLRH
jgi:hypothetical protein